MSATFRRRVDFHRSYNYLHETGPQRRGQHGMEIRFLLIGSHGAAQFLMMTGWTPLGQVDERRRYPDGSWPIDTVRHANSTDDHFPIGADLGYHWRVPLYNGQEQYGTQPCSFIGGQCYFDGSGLAATDVLRDFISEGERAVWRWLSKRYRWCLEQQAEMAAAS